MMPPWMLMTGSYLVAGIIVFCISLRQFGWDNAKNSRTGRFRLDDEDVGYSAVIGWLWPIAVAVVACIVVKNSAQQGHLGRLVEGKPPKKMRKDILKRKIDADHRALGMGTDDD